MDIERLFESPEELNRQYSFYIHRHNQYFGVKESQKCLRS